MIVSAFERKEYINKNSIFGNKTIPKYKKIIYPIILQYFSKVNLKST